MGVWQGPGLTVPWDWDSQCAPDHIHAPAGPFHPLWCGRVLPGCTSPARPASLPCTDTQGGTDGVSGISFLLHPGSPPSTPMGLPRAALPPGSQMGLDCPRTRAGSVWSCLEPAPAITPRFSHPAPTSAQASSPVLHHVHHHPVRGVHRLANQVLEEDEDLHEEVLPGRRRCQELSSTTVPSRGDAVLSTGAGSGPRHLPARASPLWSGDVGCAGVQSRWHQCQVQARHWDWWDAPAEMRDGEAGRCYY